MEDKVLDAQYRAELKNKKRIVVKVGTSSLTVSDTHLPSPRDQR